MRDEVFIVTKVSPDHFGYDDVLSSCEASIRRLGVEHIDQFIRQAVSHCWKCLPRYRRTREELEEQINRIVKRALEDFSEDRQAFGREGSL